jgi:hypothetical protein
MRRNTFTPNSATHRPLSDAQLRLLINTHPDDWPRVFAGASRRFLRKERERGLKKFPPEVVVKANPEAATLRYTPPEAERRPLTDEQLRVLLSTHPDQWAAVFPGAGERFLRGERSRALEQFPPEVVIEMDRAAAQERSAAREWERKYKSTIEQIKELEAQVRSIESFPELHAKDLRISAPAGTREATAIAIASDWHCEEPVTLEQTNGLNEYNLEIFDKRSRWYFKNLRALMDKEARDVTIRNLVLAILGDLITGSIHPDGAESNQLGPMDAIALVGDTLLGGIRQLLKETDKGVTITLVMKPGNHSRITPKQRVQTEHENALEWLLYHFISREFHADPRVRILRERNLLTYIEVHGRLLRFTHGHAFSYQGGVGGLTIPVIKGIDKWDKGRHAYRTYFGHLHTYFEGPNFTANGSMIGYSPFGEWVKAAYEPPAQAFNIIDSRHGLTARFPILLEAP